MKKLFLLFSITFWKQIYLLINSFLTGNVFAKTKLGELGENTDIGPTVRFGNYPQNIFMGAQCSLGIENHIYAGPNSKITIGDGTMIGPFAFLTTEPFSMTKENPKITNEQRRKALYFKKWGLNEKNSTGDLRQDMRVWTAPPHASKLMAHKDKLKNVTPKVPVQSIDFWCNDGADEPWEEKHDS